MDPEQLQQELLETFQEIAVQVDAVKQTAESMGIDPIQLRDANGMWALAPLLGAKAQVLHSLAILETEGDLSFPSKDKEKSNGAE